MKWHKTTYKFYCNEIPAHMRNKDRRKVHNIHIHIYQKSVFKYFQYSNLSDKLRLFLTCY